MSPSESRRVCVAIKAGNTLCGFRTHGPAERCRRMFEASTRKLPAAGRGGATSVVVASEGGQRRYATLIAAEIDVALGRGTLDSERETLRLPVQTVPPGQRGTPRS